MNKTLISILNRIEKNGFEAYIVGGFVRDILLGHPSYDIDICTNAKPKDLIAIFPSANTADAEYGSVKFRHRKYNVEITTYRKEGDYQNRRPKEITYIQNLMEDLKRRDFTINALCMNRYGETIDIFHGLEDLHDKKIKCIGNMEEKFLEDPLRILRAIRFAVVLDFSLDESITNYILEHPHCLDTLSKERVREELDKIWMCDNPQRGMNLLRHLKLLEQLSLTYQRLIPTSDICAIWAQIKGYLAYPFTKEEKKSIQSIKKIVSYGKIDDNILYKYGLYLSISAGSLLGVDAKEVNQRYQRLPIHHRKELNVHIKEMASFLQIPLQEAKKVEEQVIEEILKGTIKNTEEDIKSYLKEGRKDEM